MTRRPRLTAYAILAAMLVAAFAAVVVWHSRETRTPVNTIAEAAGLTQAACPAFNAQDGEVLSGDGTVPHGATQAALCPLPERNYPTVLPPGDALTHDVDGLADELSDYEEFHENACTALGGFSYLIAFTYADHSVRLVTGDTGGCGTINTAGVTRHGAQRAFDSYADRLREQRKTTTPPTNSGKAACVYPGTDLGNSLTVIEDIDHLISARICVRYIFHADLDADRKITPRELAVLSPDLTLSTDNGEPTLTCLEREKTPELDITLQGIDQWGGRVRVQLDSCLATTGGGEAGRLSEKGQAIVDQVITEIRRGEPSGVKR